MVAYADAPAHIEGAAGRYVAIGTDRVRACLALTHQALSEEALQYRRETRGPHDCPSQCLSSRFTANPISSGQAVRYQ